MADKPSGKRDYSDLPEPIPDTPENVARAILGTPPKTDWRYLREDHEEDCDNEENETGLQHRKGVDHLPAWLAGKMAEA